MIFRGVDDVALRRLRFLHRVNARLQILDIDFTIGICHTIEIMAAILNLCDSEGSAAEPFTGKTVQLHQPEGRPLGIGKYKLRVFIAVDLDDSGGIVNEIAVGSKKLRHPICARLQIGKVDLTIFICHVLFREGAADFFNPEGGIGQGGKICAVQFHQMDAWFLIVEEDELQDAVSTLQFDLLRCRVDDMRTICCNFLHHISAGLQVGQQDLAELVCLILTQQLSILIDLKRDIRQCLLGFAVVFKNAKAGFFLIDDGYADEVTCNNRLGVDRLVFDIAVRALNFCNTVCTRLDLIKNGHASGSGLLGVGCAGFNVLNLDDCAGKRHTGIGVFPDFQGTVRGILKCERRLFPVDHLHILGRLLAQQIAGRRRTFIYRVVACQTQGNHDFATGIGCEGSNRGALGINNFENRTAKRDLRPLLQLNDLQTGLCRIIVRIAGIGTIGGHIQRDGGIGIHHVVLQIAVLILLRTHRIINAVFIDIRLNGELDAASLTINRICRIKDLELSGIAIAGSFCFNLCDFTVVHIHDLGAGRDCRGV